jgi:preprotein translocase subunit SecF
MTATVTPPPAPPEDIPGVTRRHRPSDFYHERTNFQFIKHSRRWAILSGTLIVLSLLLLLVRGLNLGIDFKGGDSWTVTMKGGKSPKITQVRDLLQPLGFSDAKISILSPSAGARQIKVEAKVKADPIRTISKQLAAYGQISEAGVQFQQNGAGGTFTFTPKSAVAPSEDAIKTAIAKSGMKDPTVAISNGAVTVSTTQMPASPVQAVTNALAKYANASPSDVSIDQVGPTWGHEVSQKALKALLIFFLLLAAYLTIRFEWKMAVSAIVAVIHDIIFTVGMYALFQFAVTPATVTAFLTILGFSLYDTVVVFDKVLENQRALTATGRSTYGEMVNRSLNQVLMRSVSTSLVALLPVMSLLFIGSGIYGATALEEFALALAAGLFIGSYSSIFVAAPMLAWWKEKEPHYRVLADRRRRVTVAAASASTGVPVVAPDDLGDVDERTTLGVPGPPAVGRSPIQARPRQQRGKKRR